MPFKRDFDTFILAPVARATSTASGAGLSSATAQIMSTFEIVARDEFSNIQTDGSLQSLFTVRLDQVYGSAVVTGTITDLGGGGRYNVTYVPVVAGEYTLSVKHATINNHIYGSPWRNLQVAIGATSATTSTATGAALTAAVAGVEKTITLKSYDIASNARDSGGDTWSVVASKAGTSNVVATIVDNEDGTYTATYAATTSGTYSLVVKVGGTAIAASPYTLVVSPGMSCGLQDIVLLICCSNEIGICFCRTKPLRTLPSAHSQGVWPTLRPIQNRHLSFKQLMRIRMFTVQGTTTSM